MAVVINGSGTITGISVGGLPDDIVDSGTLADDAVDTAAVANDAITLAKMASGTDGNIITYDTSGNPAVVSTGSSGQVLTSAGSGAAPTMATLSANITEADQWRLTSSLGLNNDSETFITANWSRATGDGWGKIGTGMTQSSGIFTFPSTGYWHIGFNTKVGGAADARYIHHRIYTTTDNSSYGEIAASTTDINQASSYHYTGSYVHTLFDVTSTSTHKIKVSLFSITNSIQCYSDPNANVTYLTFMKLGDT